jgi:hypothetical protein
MPQATAFSASTPTNDCGPMTAELLGEPGLFATVASIREPSLRLIPRIARFDDLHIRFPSALHETILPDLRRIITVGQGRVGSSQLTIDHFGCARISAKLDLVMQLC